MKIKLLTLFCFIIQVATAQFSPMSIYPVGEGSGNYFGGEMDTYGDEIVIPSQNSAQPNASLGKVYLFDTAGQLQTTFQAENPNSAYGFGISASLGNDFLAIGAWADNNGTGSVHVFRKVAGNWSFFQEITPPNANFLDAFGADIEINGNTMFVSATGDEQDGMGESTNSGSVYIFTFNGTEWIFTQKLQPEGYFQYGRKVESKGDKTIIYSNIGNNNGLFALHLLTFTNGNWQVESTSQGIGNPQETVNDFSLDNDQIYLISLRDGDSEKVDLVNYSNGTWSFTPQVYVTPFPDQNFTRLLVSGTKMFVGSSNYILQMERKFPLLCYAKINNDWVYQGVTYGDGPEGNDDLFGATMAMSGNMLIVGASQEGVFPVGNAYIMDTTLQTNSFRKENAMVYPNPTKDTIHFAVQDDVEQVEVFSVPGNLLLTAKKVKTISFRDFPRGIYLIKITSSKGTSDTFKIIKN